MNRNPVTDLLRIAARSDLLPHRFRPPLLRRAGLCLGPKSLLMGGTRFARYAPIEIGTGVFINFACYFDAEARISIGAHTSIGDHVKIITSTHRLGPQAKRAGHPTGRPVSIGSGVWIGTGATILPGVTVGDGCVIAAGAVVIKDCLADSLYAGNPAQLKKTLEA
jgi:maltose O-acetyltransferase